MAPASSNSNGPVTAFVLAGIGLLIVVIGVLLLLRRRQLNKRPVFAGDAKPADDVAGAATAAPVPGPAPEDQAQDTPADGPPVAEPPVVEPPVVEPPVTEPPADAKD
jgi:hypothetical protein